MIAILLGFILLLIENAKIRSHYTGYELVIKNKWILVWYTVLCGILEFYVLKQP